MKFYKSLPLLLSLLLLAGCGSDVNYFAVGEYTKKVVISMFGEEPDPEEVKLYFNDDFSELIDYPSIQDWSTVEAVQQYTVEGTDIKVGELLTEVSNEILWFAMSAKNSSKLIENFEQMAKLNSTDTVVLVRNDMRITADYSDYGPDLYKPKNHLPKEFYFVFIVSADRDVKLYEPGIKPDFGVERYMELYRSVTQPEDDVEMFLLHYLYELFHF